MDLKYKLLLKSFGIGIIIASFIEFVVPLLISGGCIVFGNYLIKYIAERKGISIDAAKAGIDCSYQILFGILGFVAIVLIAGLIALFFYRRKYKL